MGLGTTPAGGYSGISAVAQGIDAHRQVSHTTVEYTSTGSRFRHHLHKLRRMDDSMQPLVAGVAAMRQLEKDQWSTIEDVSRWCTMTHTPYRICVWSDQGGGAYHLQRPVGRMTYAQLVECVSQPGVWIWSRNGHFTMSQYRALLPEAALLKFESQLHPLGQELRRWMCACNRGVGTFRSPWNLMPTNSSLSIEKTFVGEATMKIAIIAGVIEYSSMYHRHLEETATGTPNKFISQSYRVKALRRLLGPSWKVVTVGTHTPLPQECFYPTSLDLDYKNGLDPTLLSARGIHGIIQMIFLDELQLASHMLEKRYPNPLALLATCDANTVVWLVDSATSRLLLQRGRPRYKVSIAQRPPQVNPWHLAAKDIRGGQPDVTYLSVVRGEGPPPTAQEWTRQVHHPLLRLSVNGEPCWWKDPPADIPASTPRTESAAQALNSLPLILIVGAVELSQIGERRGDVGQGELRSTRRVQALRRHVGGKWNVVVATNDPWYHTRREWYSEDSVPLPYGTGQASPKLLQQYGYHGPMRHVLFDHVSLTTSQICQRFSQPLECFMWGESNAQCAIWLPDAPNIRKLLTKAPALQRQGQGWCVNFLQAIWEGFTSTCARSSTSGLCVLWDGAVLERTKAEWKKLLGKKPKRGWSLPAPLSWQTKATPASLPVHVDEADEHDLQAELPTPVDDEWSCLTGPRDIDRTHGGTDVEYIDQMERQRSAGGPHLPVVFGTPDNTIGHFYATCKRDAPPAERVTEGVGGIRASRDCEEGEVLIVPIGQERMKPRAKSTMPQILMRNGRWLRVLNKEYDVGLVGAGVTRLSKQHEHLMPWLHLTDDSERANCNVTWSQTGHPVITAAGAIPKGTWLVAYLPARAGRDEPPPAIIIPPAHTEAILSAVTEEDQEVDSGKDPPVDMAQVEEPLPPKFIIKSDARGNWAKRNATHNLGLLTLNINGKWDRPLLLEALKTITAHPVHRVDGITLLDVRIPINEVSRAERMFKAAFPGRALYVNVLPGQPRLDTPESTARHALVGGSVVIVFTRPGLDVWQVTHDPSRSGVLTRVHLKVGVDKTLLWLCAYVPHAGSNGQSGLGTKLGEWHSHCRRPHSDQELDEEVWNEDKFDAIKWTWKLIGDAVARSRANRQHVGVVLMGDLNQRLSNSSDKVTLEHRLRECGFKNVLANHFEQANKVYPTYHFGHAEPGGMLDHVCNNLTDDWWVGGGSPTDVIWSIVSDHLPIVGLFAIPALNKTRRVRVRTGLPAVVFDLADRTKREEIKAEYQKATLAIRDRFQPQDAESISEVGARLEYMNRGWAQAGRELHRKLYGPARRKKWRKSALHQGIMVALKHLDAIHKVVCGYRGGKHELVSKPSKRSLSRQLRRHLSSWKRAEERVWDGRPERPAILDYGTGHTKTASFLYVYTKHA